MINITFVTAWYNLKSKFNSETYQVWMSNFLNNSNNFNLVIYTNKESIDMVKLYTKKGNIKIILKEFHEFKCYKYDWITNQKKNSLLNQIDWKLNMLWNEKIAFVKETIDKEIFNTGWYGWCDIGYFRNVKFDISCWPNEDKINNLDKNKIYYAKVNPNINSLCEVVLNKNHNGLPSKEIPPNQISFAGGFFLINANKMNWWHNTFYEKLELYFTHNYLVKDDQIILLDSIVSNTTHFSIIQQIISGKDPWFAFQDFLL